MFMSNEINGAILLYEDADTKEFVSVVQHLNNIYEEEELVKG